MLPTSLIPDALPSPTPRRRVASPPPRGDEGDAKSEGEEVPSPDEVVVIEADPRREMEQRMTLRQLRETCKDLGLGATGNKSELVGRIIDHEGRSDGASQ